MLPWLALAAAIAQEPIGLPGQGVAGEEGPTQAWVNPALLGHDPDARVAVVVRQPTSAGSLPSSVAITGGARGLVGGLQWDREGGSDRVRIDAGAGVDLGKRFAIGGTLHGRISADQSRVDLDLGASYRPRPWLGIGAATYHLGGPLRPGDAPPEIRVGTALRPFGRALVVGLDYAHVFGVTPRDVGIATVRARPAPGCFLRAEASTDARFGLGVELYFGGIGGGVGAMGQVPPTGTEPVAPEMVLWAGTDEPEERAVPSRHIPQIVPGTFVSAAASGRAGSPPPPGELDLAPGWLEHRHRRAPQRLVVRFGGVELSSSRWMDVAGSIARARAAGVEVTAYLDGDVDRWAFAAASQADRVVSHPAATLRLTPPNDERVWLGRVADVLGVEVDVARSGAAKDAGDGWTRSAPTAASRTARVAWLDAQREVWLGAVEAGRRTDADKATAWLEGGPWTASHALAAGLIDGVAWSDQLPALLQGTDARALPVRGPQPRRRWTGQSAWDVPTTIALVPIHGPLLDRGPDGAERLVTVLERAQRDPATRAVVLDIDSPGGTAWAAEEIARAVARLEASGKPVVAYLGAHATSGALRIAVEADALIASPTTETGSIGAYRQHLALGDALARLGVDGVELQATGATGSAGWLRRWDPAEAAREQAVVDDTAHRFMDAVARRRSLSEAARTTLQDGRIVSAEAALVLGLVDRTGTRFDAILEAQAAATPARHSDPARNLDVQWLTLDAADRVRPFAPRPRATPDPAPNVPLQQLSDLLGPLLDAPGVPP